MAAARGFGPEREAEPAKEARVVGSELVDTYTMRRNPSRTGGARAWKTVTGVRVEDDGERVSNGWNQGKGSGSAGLEERRSPDPGLESLRSWLRFSLRSAGATWVPDALRVWRRPERRRGGARLWRNGDGLSAEAQTPETLGIFGKGRESGRMGRGDEWILEQQASLEKWLLLRAEGGFSSMLQRGEGTEAVAEITAMNQLKGLEKDLLPGGSQGTWKEVYIIQVTDGNHEWTVKHRYSDFHDLHEKLVAERKIDKNLLPPKKIIGKNSRSLVEKREKDLEVYLQKLLAAFPGVTPRVLAHFLHFHFYVSSSLGFHLCLQTHNCQA
ncbi:hypothetical protein P7K49_030540 [Saguinus oedipus]|uniref:PX domain-containing protein n=1 Tax=Saguinus oedipus TaxID=9490 RepID=A0ABQ9U2L7_SAGOE|nr:hypothetical protein P7K49_030540 [Saguinus oedipus]